MASINTITSKKNTTISVKPDSASAEEMLTWEMEYNDLGSVVFNTTTNENNYWNGTEWVIMLTENTVPITLVNQSTVSSGLSYTIKATTKSTETGAYNIGTYSRSDHEGTNKGSYQYGSYNKADMKGTDGYNGILYGSYNESVMSGSDPNSTNSNTSSLYGVSGKSKVSGSGDIGYCVGANISSELTNASGDVEFLQGSHIQVVHTAGNVSGAVAVALLDYDGGSGTIAGDFAYLKIQADAVNNVTGTARAIDSSSPLPSVFGGSVEASSFRVSSIRSAPTSATSPGLAGDIRVASDALYVCIANNVWVKAPLVTF